MKTETFFFPATTQAAIKLLPTADLGTPNQQKRRFPMIGDSFLSLTIKNESPAKFALSISHLQFP
jgi:hypothetical protein